jgi:hypothetical protein
MKLLQHPSQISAEKAKEKGYFVNWCGVGETGDPTNKKRSYAFLFNGCPRGNGTWKKVGDNMNLVACQAACDTDSTCNAIEINGCNANPACGGACWLFSLNGQITNGNCVTNGDMKGYRKNAS